MIEWRKHPILTPPTDDEVAAMDADELLRLHKVYHEAIENAEKDPYRYGFNLPHWKHVEEMLSDDERAINEIVALGGNRCLAPEQMIYDPVAARYYCADELPSMCHVMAWDGTKPVVAQARGGIKKEKAKLYRLTFDNGEELSCSLAHLVLTQRGWVAVGSLRKSDVLTSPFSACPHQSTLERSPLGSRQDACHCCQTVPGSRCDCHLSPRSCGEPPPSHQGNGQGASPLQADAQGHSSPCGHTHEGSFLGEPLSHAGTLGGQDNTPSRIRPLLKCARQSIRGVLLRFAARCAGTLYRASCRLCKSASRLSAGPLHQRVWWRSVVASTLERLAGGFLLLDIGLRHVLACGHNTYYRRIVKTDYLRVDYVWDMHVPVYNNYIAGGVVSHNSGKTAMGAKMVVRAAVENPNSQIFCFAQNSEVSIRQQQSAVWDWMPAEYRVKQTSSNAYISYTKKNGFTDNSFILPNGSQVIFKTYSQYQNNPTILEGAELGSHSPKWHNVGAWLDEYLLGPELISTLRFRLATRNAKLLVTFTPIDGWTEVIRDYLDGAETIEQRSAELLNGEILPYVQRSRNRSASIHYFHSQDNPFGGYNRIRQDLANRPREEILIRAYGVPVKSHTTKFPRFNKEVNVIPHDSIPTEDVTRYFIVDPAGSKNWFAVWIAVDASQTYYVYREWPGVDVGDWAEWRGGEWRPGKGAKGLGYGIRDYVEEFLMLEEGEDILDRIIDPRMGAAKYQGHDGSSSIIEDLADHDFVCNPAPGLDIEDGLQALISKMSWDTGKPTDSVNRPHFYVSEQCENIIEALSHYTGEGGNKEAWKDPVDCLRYAAISDIDHVDSKSMIVTRQGAGGY